MRSMSLKALTGAALAAACGLPACSQIDPAREATGQVSSALSGSLSGISCAALAEAVIANGPAPVGQNPPADLYSDSPSLVDSYHSSLGPYGGTNIGSN